VLFHRIFHGCVENFFGFAIAQEESRPQGGSPANLPAQLAGHFFQ
jgi:hypothetical protein